MIDMDDLSDKNYEFDENDNFHKSVSQIEKLKLPKRSQRRRMVYLGEQVKCCIKASSKEVYVDIIDITSRGISVVEKSVGELSFCVVGQKIKIIFEKDTEMSFQVEGIIANLTNMIIRETKYERLGVQFILRHCESEQEFFSATSQRIFQCHKEIRPQAFYNDPFFFNEVVIFQVNGFSSSGIDLTVSERCKSLLPLQPIKLELFFPGRGLISAHVQNLDILYKPEANKFRVFMKFVKNKKSILEKVSEYLIMFSPNVTTNQLRNLGFSIGNLDLAYEQHYTPISDNLVEDQKLKPGLFAPPLSSFKKTIKSDIHTRRVTCRLGPNPVAILGVTFCDSIKEKSKLTNASHKIPELIFMTNHIEISDLYISPNVNLMDIIMPLLKNIIRIGIQSNSRYLLVECSGQIRNALEKIGFVYENSQVERNINTGTNVVFFLMSLNLKSIVLNKEKLLSSGVWKKVYHDLFIFFKGQVYKKIGIKKSKRKKQP